MRKGKHILYLLLLAVAIFFSFNKVSALGHQKDKEITLPTSSYDGDDSLCLSVLQTNGSYNFTQFCTCPFIGGHSGFSTIVNAKVN